MRRKTVRLKLNTIKSEFHGKNVLLIDDSIVRGTTSMELVQMARDAGAKKVLPASSSILISYFSVCFILVCFFTVHFNICFYPSSLHPSCFYSTPPFPFPLSSSPSIFLPFPFFFLFPFLFPFRLISPSSSLFPPLPSSLFLPPLSSHLNLFGFSHAGILCERSTPSTLQQRVRY